MTTGGKAQPVKVISDADLRENGGTYVVLPQPAVRITGFDSADTRGVLGGPSLPVYIVNGTSLVNRGIEGGKSLPVYSLETRSIDGHYAVPVYVENYAEWDAVTPPAPYEATFCTDDFSDGGDGELATVDPNWTALVGAMLQTAGEISTSLPGYAIYVKDTCGEPPDQYAEVVFGNIAPDPINGFFMGAGVHIQADTDGYYAYVDRVSLVVEFIIGGTTSYPFIVGMSPVAGDTLRVQILDDTVSVLYNGVEVFSVVDANVPAGKAGVFGYDTLGGPLAPTITSFESGTLSPFVSLRWDWSNANNSQYLDMW